MSERMSQAVARIGAAVGMLSDEMAEQIAEKMEFAATLVVKAEKPSEKKEGKAS